MLCGLGAVLTGIVVVVIVVIEDISLDVGSLK